MGRKRNMAIKKKQEYSQIGLTKKRSSQTTDNKLCSLVPLTTFKSLGSQSLTNAPVIIIIDDDDDEKETLEPKKKKPRLTKKRSSQTTDNKLCSLVPPTTFKSLGSQSFTDAPVIIIIDDDDEKETLEPKQKKKFVSWWDGFTKSNSVVKGLPKSKDNAPNPIVDSCVSSTTNLHVTKIKEEEDEVERSLSSVHHGNVSDLNESYSDGNSKENHDRVGYGHVSLEDIGVTVVDPWLGGGGYVKDFISPLDSCFSYSSHNDLLETETETNTKKDDERSHHYNFIDLKGDVHVGEGSNSSSTGNRHVSIEELGVSVEDLKSMPWEAYDPTWEIRSEIMDPWLGGYIKDIPSDH